MVLVSTALQGGTARWLARRLGLEEAAPPAPRAVLELVSTQPLTGEMMVFQIDPASAVAGARISDLPLPPDAAVMLVLRGRQLVPARGRTVLTPGRPRLRLGLARPTRRWSGSSSARPRKPDREASSWW